MAHIVGSMYPVGCYIENSDPNFNPNYDIGGTWEVTSKVDDFIIEEGTSGIWRYRKWASDIIEAWGKHNATLSNYATLSPFYAYRTGNINLPFSIYDTVVNYSTRIGDGSVVTGNAYNYYGSAARSVIELFALSNRTGSQSTTWVIDVKGTLSSNPTSRPTIYRWHRVS